VAIYSLPRLLNEIRDTHRASVRTSSCSTG